ncbi:MAG TPA: pyrimidine 5'-nucleotidase [Burkholderiales bacterium]|nr:pyrimidine 5'-nucleotidase [Burkholderiales bacterium]
MTTWIFDLDNTLHDATQYVMPHINRSMTAYVQEQLALDEASAAALRIQYWRRYGATLLGLMRHHATDPHHFLWRTHQFPDLSRMVVVERGARHALRKLRGRKIIFSNAPAHYVHAVLGELGIATLFDAVYAIEHTRFRPKPDRAGFHRLLAAERLIPARAVLVDDTLVNLQAARRLGLGTVWVSRQPGAPSYVDAKIRTVRELPRLAARLGLAR